MGGVSKSSGAGYVGAVKEDIPERVIVVLEEPLTNSQQLQLGKVLGAAGFTGRFVGDSVANLVAYATKKRAEDRASHERDQS